MHGQRRERGRQRATERGGVEKKGERERRERGRERRERGKEREERGEGREGERELQREKTS